MDTCRPASPPSITQAYLCNDDPKLREHLLELAREWIAMAALEAVDA